MDKQQIKEAAAKASEDYMENALIMSGPRGSYRKGFIAGAEWRINSVWHDVQKELPSPDETVIVEYIIDGERDCAFTHRTESPKVITDKHGFCFYIQDAEIIRWAYVSDLLPDRKEVQP